MDGNCNVWNVATVNMGRRLSLMKVTDTVPTPHNMTFVLHDAVRTYKQTILILKEYSQ